MVKKQERLQGRVLFVLASVVVAFFWYFSHTQFSSFNNKVNKNYKRNFVTPDQRMIDILDYNSINLITIV